MLRYLHMHVLSLVRAHPSHAPTQGARQAGKQAHLFQQRIPPWLVTPHTSSKFREPMLRIFVCVVALKGAADTVVNTVVTGTDRGRVRLRFID